MDVTYLDYNATSPLPEILLEELASLALKSSGNPSSPHQFGRNSRRIIHEASDLFARYVNCLPQNIFWTSGASESNSWVIHSIIQNAIELNRTPQILTTPIEHDATLTALKERNAQASFIQVTEAGLIDLSHFEAEIKRKHWDLVSVVHANNETGVIQPVETIAKISAEHGVPVHLDSAQALAKIPVSLNDLGVSFATFSGHKIGAPKGVGALVVNSDALSTLKPLIHGKQQNGARGGTLNTFGIAAFARALQLDWQGNRAFPKDLSRMHREFEEKIKSTIPGTIIHGETAPRLGNTTFVGFEDVDGDGILLNLDLEGICTSSGSACSSGSLKPSHVLLAMGCSPALARSSVRLSSGRSTRWSDFERVLDVLPEIVGRIRAG